MTAKDTAMIYRLSPLVILSLISCLATAATGLDEVEPFAPYLNGVFPPTISSVPSAISDSEVSYSQRNYFPGIEFVEPLRIVEHPTRNELIVIGKDALGHAITHAEGATDKRLFFDLRPIVAGRDGPGEGGISDLEFHPEFGNSGSLNASSVFISYWWSPVNSGEFTNGEGDDGYMRVSRFSVQSNLVDLSSEQVLINQYDREFWHIGMDLEFGPDGFLYIAMGDETPTTCCDRADSTQRLNGGLWAGVLRIDVDNDPSRSHAIRRQPIHPAIDPTTIGPDWPESFTQGYSIPNDNPFQAADGSILEEFYSLGLRHPWTMDIDDATGDVWVGDVGRLQREELNLIAKGDNHEWPYKEGNINGPNAKPNNVIGNETGPVFEYNHEEGRAIILGGVYRGDRFPELVGKVLFSDYVNGQLWASTRNGSSYDTEKIATVSAGYTEGVNSYLFDSRGDVLMVRTGGALADDGRIDVLSRSGNVEVSTDIPQLLSQTGAFADLLSRTAVEGCISYEENTPFWSDAAVKSRWLCVPNDGTHDAPDEQIVFSEDEPWTFPAGSVLIKHFDMEAVEGDPQSTFPLETRFFVVGTDGYYGLTYRWTDSGTDATLVPSSGESRPFSQLTTEGFMSRVWEYPSRTQCQECHTEQAGSTLGINTRQLNGLHNYRSTGRQANQIETLASLGMFDQSLDLDSLLPSVITSSPPDDLSASVEDRARSYLDANCGYCHMPSGVRANFDARLTTPLDEQNLLNGQLLEGVGIEGERVIVAGDPERSIALHRAALIGEGAMPPLAKNRVDDDGIALLEEWISGLTANADNASNEDDQTPADNEDDAEDSGVNETDGGSDGSIANDDTNGGTVVAVNGSSGGAFSPFVSLLLLFAAMSTTGVFSRRKNQPNCALKKWTKRDEDRMSNRADQGYALDN